MSTVLIVTAWAVGLMAMLALAYLPKVRRRFDAPRDVEWLAPGADRFTRLYRPGEAYGLVDAVLLPDGRLATSGITTFKPEEPRPADVWDPRTRRWSAASVVVPLRKLPEVNLTHDDSTRWASLGDGRALVLERGSAGAARPRIEPGGAARPELEVFPDGFVAAELQTGTLLVCGALGDDFVALRLEKDGASWQRLPPPPCRPAGSLVAGQGERAVLVGLGELALWADGAWRKLPRLREPRHACLALAAADGSVLVAGGLLLEAQDRLRGDKIFWKLCGACGAVWLGVVAYRSMTGADRPALGAIAAGLVIGFALIPYGALRLMNWARWH